MALRRSVAVAAACRQLLPRAAPSSAAACGALSTHRWMSDAPTPSVAPGLLEDEGVLEHLVCPISKLPLRYDREHGRLVCDEINVAYPIRNGIPVLIPAEGRILGGDSGAEQ